MAKRVAAGIAATSISLASLQAMPPAQKRELDALLFSYDSFKQIYKNDPAGMVCDCFDWSKVSDRPTTYQLDILAQLATHQREAVRGPHGLGKTALAAHAIIWFALTRDGSDWKIPTTAGSWRQLTHYLWPEVHKWLRLVRWDRVGRPPLIEKQELLERGIKLATGEAFAVASDQPALIEGAHADHLLFVYDESKSIPDPTFDAAEGAFSGAGSDTGREALALAISTPGEPQGRFYAIHARKRGFEDWRVRHVTADEAQAAGRMSKEWQQARLRMWGEESSLYQNRVLGEFAASEEVGVIPLAWIEAAQERWREWADAQQRLTQDLRKPPRFKAIGVDVAYGGEDRTTIAPRIDTDKLIIIPEIRISRVRNTQAVAGDVRGMQRARGGVAIVDVIGYGAGTLDRIREEGGLAVGFNAGAKAAGPDGKALTDESGELEFSDLRSAAWWHARDCLSPTAKKLIALPPDEMLPVLPGEDAPSLTGELISPRWEVVGGGRIKVESKDEIRKRIKRSTDLADPIIQALFLELLQAPTQGMPFDLGTSASKWRI